MMQQMQAQMAGRGGAFPPGAMLGDRGRGAGGRGRGRKRKERDLNRAPRQPSQYNLFMKTEVARIKQVQPELSHKEAFKEAARNWGVSDQNPQKRQALGGEDAVEGDDLLKQEEDEIGGGLDETKPPVLDG